MRENMPELIALSGLPGSGKTTYVEELKKKGFAVVSSDGIRDEFFSGEFSLNTNDEVFGILHKRAAEFLLSGKDTVIDAVNAAPFARMDIMFGIREEMFAAGKWDFVFFSSCIVLETPLQLCLFYNSLRKKPCPEKAVIKMHDGFAYPDRREGFSEVRSIYRKTNLSVIAEYPKEQKERLLAALEEIKKNGKYTLSGRCRKEAAEDTERTVRVLQKGKT